MSKLEELYKDIERGDLVNPKVAVDRALAIVRGEILTLMFKHQLDESTKEIKVINRIIREINKEEAHDET
jgi:hypothetical protein